MQAYPEKHTQTYKNVMEILVSEELERQLKNCPEKLLVYINKLEVATYALNRLPALYASCEKGKNIQKLLAQKQYREEIKKVVRQALAAVQRDPLRASIPLIAEDRKEYHVASAALQNLKSLLEEENLLNYQDLNWNNLVNIVRQALTKAAWSGIAPKSPPFNSHNSAQTNVDDWADSRYLR
jgi:hypothetical protein